MALMADNCLLQRGLFLTAYWILGSHLVGILSSGIPQRFRAPYNASTTLCQGVRTYLKLRPMHSLPGVAMLSHASVSGSVSSNGGVYIRDVSLIWKEQLQSSLSPILCLIISLFML